MEPTEGSILDEELHLGGDALLRVQERGRGDQGDGRYRRTGSRQGQLHTIVLHEEERNTASRETRRSTPGRCTGVTEKEEDFSQAMGEMRAL